jgi:hypothetical protein
MNLVNFALSPLLQVLENVGGFRLLGQMARSLLLIPCAELLQRLDCFDEFPSIRSLDCQVARQLRIQASSLHHPRQIITFKTLFPCGFRLR